MKITVTAIAFCALVILNALLALTAFTNALTLWPVPEEPWLKKAYGNAYLAYEAESPRFLSLSKFFEKPIASQ